MCSIAFRDCQSIKQSSEFNLQLNSARWSESESTFPLFPEASSTLRLVACLGRCNQPPSHPKARSLSEAPYTVRTPLLVPVGRQGRQDPSSSLRGECTKVMGNGLAKLVFQPPHPSLASELVCEEILEEILEDA